jgi:hypothetical protein
VLIPERVYDLEFGEDHPLAGLHIKVRSRSLEYMESIEKLPWFESIGPFIDNVVGWDLEVESGQVALVTVAAMRTLESAAIKSILRAWMLAGWGVTSPLDSLPPSGDGQPSPDTASTEPSNLGLDELSSALPN